MAEQNFNQAIRIGRDVEVRNEPGHAGIAAARLVARSRPNGGRLLVGNNGLLAANLQRFLYKGGTGLDRLIVNAGTYHFDHDALDYTENLTIEVNTDGQGTAEVIFDHTQHLAGLIVGREGYVEITHTGSEPSKVVVTRLLQISGGAEPGGRIDVKDTRGARRIAREAELVTR